MKNKQLVLASVAAILAVGMGSAVLNAADAPKAPAAAKAVAGKMSCNGKNGCSAKKDGKHTCTTKNCVASENCATKDAKHACNGKSKDAKHSCKAGKAAAETK